MCDFYAPLRLLFYLYIYLSCFTGKNDFYSHLFAVLLFKTYIGIICILIIYTLSKGGLINALSKYGAIIT